MTNTGGGNSERSLERRSGLSGLGGRPTLHPSWGEVSEQADVGEAFLESGNRWSRLPFGHGVNKNQA